MPRIDLTEINNVDNAAPCVALFYEYVGWVISQFQAIHGVAFDQGAIARVHDDFSNELPKLFSQRGMLLLATVDGEPAGVLGLKPIAHSVGELKRMYVRDAFRGMGIARTLLTTVIGDARELGYERLLLESADFMVDAHALYRSLGFRDTERFAGTEGAASGVSEFELFMSLEL